MITKEQYVAHTGHKFAVARTRTASGLCLHRDNKTGALSTIKHSSKGKSWQSMVANAFALPAGPPELGGACVGATEYCKFCYAVHGLEIRPGFRNLVLRNLEILHEAHAEGRLVEVLLEAVDLSADAARHYGIKPTFRWHSDGDVFAGWYARAIRQTAILRPDVEMWIYTRSFRPGASFIGALIGNVRPPNLHVFLSVDPENVEDAIPKLRRFEGRGLRTAILASSPEERAELEERLSVRTIVCPATARYTHDGHGSSFVTGVDGKRNGIRDAEVAQGACNACRFCFKPDERSVVFNLHGGKRTTESVVRVLLSRR